ncbi:MAG: hypothetical protein ACN4GM_15495 [Gammaproteobacteria bacterium]
MFIKQKSVRSVRKYLNVIKSHEEFRVSVKITPEMKSLAERAGFPDDVRNGDTLLPNAIGNISRFNAEGKYIKRTDLPKEERYITTIEWTWEQWCGRGQTEAITESRDIYRECYQREFITPPSVELTWVEKDGECFISSGVFAVKTVMPEQLKHVINLFLELFGECEIRKSDMSSYFPPKLRRVNWEMLPPGEYPWDKVRSFSENLVKDKHSRYSNVILDRQDSITQYQPDEVYVGTGGFRAYIAYVFKSKQLVVLESIVEGNATYVFGNDWMRFSSLTKAEILNEKLQKDRIIHSKGWETRIQLLLGPERQLAV